MIDFLKKLQEWILEKEEEMAKNSILNPKDIDEQIYKIKLKIKELKDKCEEDIKEFDYILNKLHWIKAKVIECQKEIEKEIQELD